MKNKIKVIGFDADDTLWVNEPLFREAEHQFSLLFKNKFAEDEVIKVLFKIEIENLPKYGYGTRGFMLSMIDTTLKLNNEKITTDEVKRILELGNELLEKPREILEGVEQTLATLYKKYRLILITKGDLLEQEQKLKRTGLAKYFHHIEILSEKHESNYNVLLSHLDIRFDEFMMVGNSLKSDILPVVKLGSYGAYIPFHITWQYELVNDKDLININYLQLEKISDLIDMM